MPLSGHVFMWIQTACHLRSISPFMLMLACYSVGRFDTSPGENTWNAIKFVVGLVCASCKPPLVNMTVGCTQEHWLDGEEGRERDTLQKMPILTSHLVTRLVLKSDFSLIKWEIESITSLVTTADSISSELFCRNKAVCTIVATIISWKRQIVTSISVYLHFLGTIRCK